jgi:flagellar motor component MotA
MRSILGIMGFLGIVVAGIVYGSPLGIFIDLPSILIVCGSIVSLSFAKYSFKELLTFSDEVVMSLINFH